ncbi:MAG: SDR family NAD(P)-dependent oxidoreductase [Pseudomonadota bacterium]
MIDQTLLLELTESYLKSVISEFAKSLDADFDSFAPFGELGIDSFFVLKIVKKLEGDFGTLPKTLLFENFNIHDLAQYFIKKHQQTLSVKFAKELQSANPSTDFADGQVKPDVVAHEVKVNPLPANVTNDLTSDIPLRTPVLILEKDAQSHPELGALIQDLFAEYKNESSVSRGTRNIAPNVFIGSEKRGYFNYSRSKNIILAYGYTGPKDYFPELAWEMYQHCIKHNLQLNIFASDQLEFVGDVPFSATPFGVMQRILNIKEFTLEGGAMRRLRYQVSKFDKEGACRTEEYHCGSNPEIAQNIANIMDQWCTTRTMVNPLIYIVREEILAGTLSREHRIFLTYIGDVLQNVILISAMSAEQNGCLMDLEFYSLDMPLGGLEFAIVKIIETLVAEGCNMLSLGGTYGCKLNPSSNADAEIEQILDDLRKQNIFNDEGNLQFKNKFRPENESIFLCRAVGSGNPDNVIDLIMMIADPAKMQTSDEEHQYPAVALHQVAATLEKTPVPEIDTQATHQISEPTNPATVVGEVKQQALTIEGEVRSVVLSDFGFNPLNIPQEQVEFDLKTDSWAQLKMPAIEKQMAHLRTQLQQPVNVNESLKAIFPFNHFLLTASGRAAESILCKALPKKGVVLQNLLFPTGIFQQIDKGFTPRELPHPEVFRLESDELYKGNLAWSSLQEQVAQYANDIAFVCIEVSDNAAGGHPVSVQHLKQVKHLLNQYSIPLIIDGTRILENAQLVIESEKEYAGKTIWAVAQEIFSYADIVIGSLAKDFCVNKGGLIATNDENLFAKLQDLIQEEGNGLDVIDKKLIALSLQNRKQIETSVLRRMEGVRQVWQALKSQKVPVVQPAGAHCILIDVKQIAEFKDFAYPVASFLAWMYLNTGIRAGAHSVGMQKNTTINDLVRLAIPVGLKQEQIKDMIDRLVDLFSSKKNIPEITFSGNASESFGDVHANYSLIKYHNISGNLVAKTSVENISLSPTIASTSHPTLKSMPVSSTQVLTATEAVATKNNANLKTTTAEITQISAHKKPSGDIAIVGMAGRYPKAKNLNEMWQNLIQGKDCIETIPDNRFEKRRQNEFGEKYRGGFIDDVDKFDSLFFNISPREAETIDPQERLFLEVAWEAIEDAGYYPETLAKENTPRNIGVFVGAVWAMYQTIGSEERLAGNRIYTNSFLWSIANRVSYSLNLTGPSLTVDTACSASLTALYLACEAIQNEECSSAIVGGVNLDLHQSKQEMSVAGGALSKDGVCRSFGKGANGYVAGEGVGAVFLKPLEQAIHDGDNIHGVIKSVAINHGGRTSGFSVPNPKVQSDLILSALTKAKIDARSIGYIEAHGTGTELGDPIEITGLTNAFEAYNVKNQTCPIGSIKTNIGHLEAAAGVVSVCKILLQMKHRQLVPSLHSTELNDFIDFKNSPFYVEQKLEEWKGKEVDGVRYPLRAGISSFGAGGSNAHVILESYEPAAESVADALQPIEQIFPLSARNEDQLRDVAINLRKYLQQDFTQEASASQQNLNNLAYTLQVGRKSFDCRVAIIAKTKTELAEMLSQFIDGKKDDHILTGNVKNSDGITKLLNRKEKEEFINLLSQRRDPLKLAQLWTDGLLSDWQGFQAQGIRKRISLPTYPFADKRHWAFDTLKSIGVSLQSKTVMHPLIDSNESTFERQIFKKTFTEKEFFIYDHLVSDIPTLPGVAYLDLARKAGEMAVGRKVQKIKNILWVSPLTVKNSIPTEAFIELKPNGDLVQFEVYSEGENGRKQLYSQGKLFFATPQEMEAEPEYIDIASIRARCEKVIDGKDAYPLFKSLGLDLGPSFQVLQEIFKNEDEIFGVLKIPEFRSGDFHDFILHPSLVDGSFQAAMAARLAGTSGEMFVPYSLGEVEILHPLTENCFSYVVASPDNKKENSKLSKMNVFILDEDGKVLVKVRDSVGVPLTDVHEKPAQHGDAEGFAKLYYSTVWENTPLDSVSLQQNSLDSILLFDINDTLRNLYQERLNYASNKSHLVVLVQPGNTFQNLGNGTYEINPQVASDYTQLFDSLKQQQVGISKICYAWPADPVNYKENSLTEALEKGVYSFLNLCQALIEQKLENKIQLLYLYLVKNDDLQPHNEAINGFAKILQVENPKLLCKTLEVQQLSLSLTAVVDEILAEFNPATQDDLTVRYAEQKRYVRKIKQFDLESSEHSSPSLGMGIKQNGVYLITGGAGGLGLIFAEFLAKEFKARLVLTGRSKLSQEQQEKLEALRQLGAEVLYVPTDVSNYDAVAQLIKETKSQFGEINGIIHSAGVLRDSYIRKKTREEMQAVFAPKIYGTVYLDELTKTDNLDFFVTFSSLAALAGNAGQSDYSFANHFMDSFAARRELLHAKGQRSGKALSINWSIWADGGMRLDEQTELFFKKNLGIKSLSIETGINAFIKGLNSTKTQVAVLEGVQEKIELAWGLRKKEAPVATVAATVGTAEVSAAVAPPQGADGNLQLLVQNALSKIVMDFLKIDASDIDLDSILLDLGFDSIGLTTFANLVNEKYLLDVTPVLFFEYPSIREISKFISTEHKQEVLRAHQSAGASSSASAAKPVARAVSTEVVQEASFKISKGWVPGVLTQDTTYTSGGSFSPERRFIERPVAIVGMSGVMPQSENLEEFWEKLKAAKNNMVTVIPRDRWNWEDYDGDPIKEVNKSNSKWGGFMKEVDKFDPLFFGISPREAEMMDPQQRIFLEDVWKAVEDSGHKVSDLAGTKTGLFVGAATHDYTDLMNTLQISLDGYTASGNSHSVLVNRVSFLLGLRGPSAPLDTACSSSLIAVHRALESIHTGSSDMAIVGGVQVMLTPAAYISFGMAGMLSNDGKCKSFDKRADGYVRGEGSGAIFLKPLTMAEADGNHIYAVIKSTAENHGGRVTFLTAPNPNAQAELLIEAYEKAEIDPTTVGYIECHGTGTSLGDPIEIQALKKSFSELYKKYNKTPDEIPHCGLGTVKSNIGHLETAAGIAGIFKVLLAMKHKQIPATLHFEELNPYINLKGSPFFVVDKTMPWEAIKAPDGTLLPRRAGVSSFGFGGANAHIVLEEYIPSTIQSPRQAEGPFVIVLSAKHEDRLKAYAQLMLAHIEKQEINLTEFAYTLQVGRDAMTERLGFTVNSVEELQEKLRAYVTGQQNIEDVYCGRVSRNKESINVVDADTDGETQEAIIEKWFADKKLSKLLEVWVKGLDMDWNKLYAVGSAAELKPKRISLPTYPFARERYWFGESDRQAVTTPRSRPGVAAEVLHPLLHSNTSIFGQQRYSSTFSGKEIFLSDYHLNTDGALGVKVLPAVAYLEMARAAVAQATLTQGTPGLLELHNTSWLQPLAVSENKQVTIALFENDENEIGFEIYSAETDDEGQSQEVIHGQGTVVGNKNTATAKLDLQQLKGQMSSEQLDPDNLYAVFANMGMNYGESYQRIKAIYPGDQQQLVQLNWSEAAENAQADYVLHPGLMESALQAALGLMIDPIQLPNQPVVPFALESLKILSPCSDEMYAWVRYSRGSKAADKILKLDIDLIDSQGNICIKFKALTFNNVQFDLKNKAQRSNFESLLNSISNSDMRSPKLNETENSTNIFEQILDNIY